MNSDLIKWVLGILFTLILGAYGYTKTVSDETVYNLDKTEKRWTERMDRFEAKLDRLLER